MLEILFQKDIAGFHEAAQLRTDADEIFLQLRAADETFDERLFLLLLSSVKLIVIKYIFFIFHQPFPQLRISFKKFPASWFL